MGDQPWKRFEREIAALIGGRRFWSNSGETLDCVSDRFVAQCKLVQRLSLEQIASLTEAINNDGHAAAKFGILALKVRRSKGHPSPTLVVMTSETFTRLTRYTQEQP